MWAIHIAYRLSLAKAAICRGLGLRVEVEEGLVCGCECFENDRTKAVFAWGQRGYRILGAVGGVCGGKGGAREGGSPSSPSRRGPPPGQTLSGCSSRPAKYDAKKLEMTNPHPSCLYDSSVHYWGRRPLPECDPFRGLLCNTPTSPPCGPARHPIDTISGGWVREGITGGPFCAWPLLIAGVRAPGRPR